MVRPRLLEWQWSDYAAKHRNRANLLLHIVSVPLFQIGTIILVTAVLMRTGGAAVLALACMAAALVAQGRGHRLEREAPTPFDGAADFVSRFVAEQWVTFPRFVLSGGWYRNLTGGGAR
ncbi:MAG TPA: Mpo1-like protein [Methylomirabilota bacterium]|nr:Mpo1-like protein [Methylomirabilota bacterium]